jgi:hypothetical protein
VRPAHSRYIRFADLSGEWIVSSAAPRPRFAGLLVLTATLWLFACVNAAAASRPIYKCTLADGKTTFSDEPCATAATEPPPAIAAGTGPGAKPRDKPAAETAPAKRPAAPADPADCTGWMPPEDTVAVEQPQKIAQEDLPHDAAGRPIEILVSKRGPMTVVAACSAMVSTCSHKSADPRGSIDACFKSAPRCATDQPWQEEGACCPQTCWQKYVDLRRQCVDASSASYRALFQEHCVSGSGDAAQASSSP